MGTENVDDSAALWWLRLTNGLSADLALLPLRSERIGIVSVSDERTRSALES